MLSKAGTLVGAGQGCWWWSCCVTVMVIIYLYFIQTWEVSGYVGWWPEVWARIARHFLWHLLWSSLLQWSDQCELDLVSMHNSTTDNKTIVLIINLYHDSIGTSFLLFLSPSVPPPSLPSPSFLTLPHSLSPPSPPPFPFLSHPSTLSFSPPPLLPSPSFLTLPHSLSPPSPSPFPFLSHPSTLSFSPLLPFSPFHTLFLPPPLLPSPSFLTLPHPLSSPPSFSLPLPFSPFHTLSPPPPFPFHSHPLSFSLLFSLEMMVLLLILTDVPSLAS